MKRPSKSRPSNELKSDKFLIELSKQANQYTLIFAGNENDKQPRNISKFLFSLNYVGQEEGVAKKINVAL